MPRLLSVVDRDPATHRLRRVSVFCADQKTEVEIKVVRRSFGGGVDAASRVYLIGMLGRARVDDKQAFVALGEAEIDARGLRALRDHINQLLDEHLDVTAELVSS